MRLKTKYLVFNNLATTTAVFTAVEKNKYLTIVNISLLENLKTLTAETFDARLAQASLACKRDAANFVRSTDFDDKLKNLIKMLLQIKVKAISTKGLTKDLIKGYKVLNAANIFLRNISKSFSIYAS